MRPRSRIDTQWEDASTLLRPEREQFRERAVPIMQRMSNVCSKGFIFSCVHNRGLETNPKGFRPRFR
jgi:hypothetical protein